MKYEIIQLRFNEVIWNLNDGQLVYAFNNVTGGFFKLWNERVKDVLNITNNSDYVFFKVIKLED